MQLETETVKLLFFPSHFRCINRNYKYKQHNSLFLPVPDKAARMESYSQRDCVPQMLYFTVLHPDPKSFRFPERKKGYETLRHKYEIRVHFFYPLITSATAGKEASSIGRKDLSNNYRSTFSFYCSTSQSLKRSSHNSCFSVSVSYKDGPFPCPWLLFTTSGQVVVIVVVIDVSGTTSVPLGQMCWTFG